MPGRVADACVLAAIFFEEPQADQAYSLVGDSELYEPSLVVYELTSVARKKSLSHPERRLQLSATLALALRTPMTWAAVDHTAVLELSLAARISSYDATYLHVAQALQLPLATLDQKFRRAAVELGIPTVDG